MSIRPFVPLLALGAVLALPPAPVTAQLSQATTLTVSSGSGWRSTTGHPGARRTVIRAPAGKVLTGIDFWERGDRPCGMVFRFQGNGRDSNESWGCTGGQGDRLQTWFRYSSTAPRGVRQVRFCTRSNNNRMKGIRLRAAPISVSGVGSDPGLFLEETRPRCNNNWSSTVSGCPSGEVVTAVRLEYDTGSRNSAVGLAVFCSRARMTS